MSQIIKPTSDSNLPPDVLTRLKVDTSETLPVPGAAAGTITPQANILTLQGDNGIITSTDPAQPGLGMVRFARGSVLTSDATPTTIVAFQIPTNTCLTMQVLISGLDTGSNDGVGGYTTATVKNIAGTTSLIVIPDIICVGEGAISTATFTISVTGTTFLIQVIGVAGRNIQWGCCIPGITINIITEVV